MNKYRIFKCKLVDCYCAESWIISRGGVVVSMSALYDWALEWVLEQIEKEKEA